MGRRTVASITGLALLAGTIGIPVPEFSYKSNADYPCRDHACGCKTAKMCRTHCCCFKPKPITSCGKSKKTALKCAVPQRRAEGRSLVLVARALQCQGLIAFLSLGAIFPPPVTVVDLRPHESGDLVPVVPHDLRPLAYLQPEKPPPRT